MGNRYQSISRRSFLKQAAIATAGLAAASSALASCVAPTAPQAPGSEAAPAAGAEAVTLRHWHIEGGPPGLTWLEDAGKRFAEEHAGKSVELTFISSDAGYDEKVTSSIAGGQPPDTLDTTGSPRFGFRGLLADLNPFLETSTLISAADFIPGQVVRASWGDQLFAIPKEADANAMFWWNKDVFAEAGLDPESPPTTWEELRVAAEKTIKVGDGGRFDRLGFLPTYSQSWFYVWLWLNGGELYDPYPPDMDTPPTVTFNNQKGVEAISEMLALSEIAGGQQAISAFEQGFQTGAQNPFFSGQLAMMCSGDWEYGSLQEYAPDLNYGVTSMPLPPDGVKTTSSGGWAYSIPTGSQIEDAWQYVEWLSSYEISLWRAEAEKKLGAHLEVLKNPMFTEDPVLKVAADLLAVAHGFPEPPWVGEMWTRVNVQTRDEVLLKAKTPQEALDLAAEDMQKIIDEVYAQQAA